MKALIKFQEVFGVDRMLHILVAVCIVLLSYPFDITTSLAVTIIVCVLGVLKEFIDKVDGSSGWDWIDLTVTWAGAWAAFVYLCIW